MSRSRWVLFDLDGTLFDYEAAETAAVGATLLDAGVAVTDEAVAAYREINRRHWVALERGTTTPERLRTERWQEFLSERGLPGVDAADLARAYLRHLAAGSHLLDGAAEVVATVAATHRIAYITNGLPEVQRARLEASPLTAHGEVLVISEEVGVAKPHPAIFDVAFERMGSPDRSDVTLVGDSLTADIAGGLAYGLTTVWLAPAAVASPGAAGPSPTHRIAHLRDLPPLLA